ncbi:MAG: hypothetical protein V8S03_09580 [Faecalimonas umbilicata]|uniref:flavodoxin family protein n=1 Tax=Faecalimonas umbilicata TaxID=1912855 RepID=UPI00300F43BA
MSVYSIYFSPTNSTKEIANLVANEVGSYQEIDLSKKEDMVDQVFDADDVCVIGVPSYGGRVPGIALERMNKFKGNHAKAILVVSYGNRAFEDTLKELADDLSKVNSFMVKVASKKMNAACQEEKENELFI